MRLCCFWLVLSLEARNGDYPSALGLPRPSASLAVQLAQPSPDLFHSFTHLTSRVLSMSGKGQGWGWGTRLAVCQEAEGTRGREQQVYRELLAGVMARGLPLTCHCPVLRDGCGEEGGGGTPAEPPAWGGLPPPPPPPAARRPRPSPSTVASPRVTAILTLSAHNLGPRNRSKWFHHSRLREFRSHGPSSLTYFPSQPGRKVLPPRGAAGSGAGVRRGRGPVAPTCSVTWQVTEPPRASAHRHQLG